MTNPYDMILVMNNNKNDLENLTLNDRIQMEKILEEIFYIGCKNHTKVIENNTCVQKLYGVIGNHVSFNGTFFTPNKNEQQKGRLEINLFNKAQNLARITTENGFVSTDSIPAWADIWEGNFSNTTPIPDTTKINVFSPRFNTKTGISETFYTADQKHHLTVYCAENEIPNRVVKNLFQTISYSKDYVEVKEKLSKLNLPSNIKVKNLDALVDSVINQIYTEKTTREM